MSLDWKHNVTGEDPRLEIEERIKQILVSKLLVHANTLSTSNSNTPLLGHGIGLDSAETLALVIEIENEFCIQVDDADFIGLFKTMRTLAEYILRKTSGNRIPCEGGTQ